MVIGACIYPVQAIAYWALVSTLPHLWVRIWGDIREMVFDIVFLLFFITAILYLLRKNSVKSRITPALPVLFYWGVVYTALDIDIRLAHYYTFTPLTSVYEWINNWNPIIELICLSWLILFFSWRLFIRFQQLQSQVTRQALDKEKERNELIAQQKIVLEDQVTSRTAELKQSLENLKATQSQLVQSEKMASLGELTAGIAHEIQNPLNFVNNFSEVNTELVDELKSELATGNIQSATAIADNIKDNEEKISHHGKRADAIVKSMLQHSRTSSGQIELTDINALADEYLRLTYHGLRAKDKTFNVRFETDFDHGIGKINIVQQDIGRMLLNLINNAFYAASLPARGGLSEADNKKIPTVWLTTKREGNKVVISVRDNGPGIPTNTLDKIFQPFFTTKPPGQGTGLGLSLSYDIVKAHGGEIKVETKEGDGTTFLVNLPVNR